jgi:hypothetical protein
LWSSAVRGPSEKEAARGVECAARESQRRMPSVAEDANALADAQRTAVDSHSPFEDSQADAQRRKAIGVQ